MEDLKAIMDKIREERPATSSNPLDSTRVYRVVGPDAEKPQPALQTPVKWDDNDKESNISMTFSRYEIYWMMWRLQVHLRSYQYIEWPEMKSVIGDVHKRLEEEWRKSLTIKAATGEDQSSPDSKPVNESTS